MNRSGYSWLLMVGVAALVGGAGRGEAADNENAKEAVVLRFKPLIVMDPLLRQEAGRVLIPADWKGEGTVLWRPHPQHPASPVLTVANPAGAEAIRIYPDFNSLKASASRRHGWRRRWDRRRCSGGCGITATALFIWATKFDPS
jgi:hypothetical protein